MKTLAVDDDDEFVLNHVLQLERKLQSVFGDEICAI